MSPGYRRSFLHAGVATMTVGTAGCTSLTIPDGKITDYESLSEEGQVLFRTLLEEGSVKRPSDRIPSKLWESKYIRYKGDVYKISKEPTNKSVATYSLYISSVPQSEVDESELVRFSNLSQESQDIFKKALKRENYSVRGKTLPGELSEAGFVKYEGEYYKSRVTTGDIRVWKLSAGKVWI